mgnify:CR=1 FL=1
MSEPIVHEHFIRESFTLARQASRNGNHPFGALLVKDGEILLTAENSVNSDHDITRHAELNLVSQASRQFSPEILAQVTLYTSTEPCAMCTGAIYWAGIPVIVFGCSAESMSQITGGTPLIPCREILDRARRPPQVIGPILNEEGVEIHQHFWR